MIFIHYCHTPDPEDPNRYEVPATLAVVCSQWRSILLTTPSLWTTIHLGPEKCSPAIVNHQLELSGSLPLIIYIKGPLDERPSAGNHNVYEETDKYFKAVLTKILNALPRWKHVCLDLTIHELEAFGDLLQGTLQPVYVQGQNDDAHRALLCPSFSRPLR
ncbi:hypothetical protein BDZ89DRAFT_38007 [Hymenopellis radicata]|nr:hypothetical protein BDZ89DRAFT_38007 [Hymenopellis radicata]